MQRGECRAQREALCTDRLACTAENGAVLVAQLDPIGRRRIECPCRSADRTELSEVEIGSLGRARQTVGLKQGIDQETARKMVKAVKGHRFKKVQVQIQADELRVTSPSKNELQEVMAFLRGEDWGMELKFGNYR